MRKTILATLIVLTISIITSCTHTRPLTEQYIKTKIETHSAGNFSTIQTYSIFKGVSANKSGFMDLTGYKYNNTKKLVIGADIYVYVQKKYKEDPTTGHKPNFIELTQEQCNSIITNYQILLDKIKSEKVRGSKEVTHDYTVSNELFISYKKTRNVTPVLIDLWINGAKFSFDSKKIIKSINKFISY